MARAKFGLGMLGTCGLALLLAACGGAGSGSGSGGGGSSSDTIGGTISGLTASGLTLADGSQTVSPSANATSFTFPTAVASGTSYSVTVSAQPSGETCSVANGSGTISANVTNVQLACAANNLSGTAATGSPIAGATVTLVDSTGKQVTVQTAANGQYSLSTSGLTPPFLVKVVTASASPNGYGSGTTFYGVSDQASPNVINITPLTDLIIRNWYAAQSTPVGIATAFSNPAANPLPSVAEVQLIQAVVLDIVQPLLQAQGVSPVGLDLVSGTFAADGKGIDAALDQIKPITYNTAGTTATLTLSPATNVTQATTVTATAGATQVVTTTSDASGTVSSSDTSTVVPTTPGEAAALTGVETTLNSLAALINSKGTALQASDVAPLIDTSFLNGGASGTQQAKQIVNLAASGMTVNALTVTRIASYDATNNLIGVVGSVESTVNGVTVMSPIGLGANVGMIFKQESNGSWLLYGDQQEAKIQAYIVSQTQNDISSTSAFNELILQLQAPAASTATPCASSYVSSATVFPATAISGTSTNGGGSVTIGTGGYSLQEDPTVYQNSSGGSQAGGYTCEFDVIAQGLLDLPASGLPGVVGDTVGFSLNGGSQVPVLARTIGAYTTETIDFSNLSSHALSSLQLGQPMTVSWTLPVTFALYRIQFDAEVYVANGSGGYVSCNATPATFLGTTSTSLTLTLPATCNGVPVTSTPNTGSAPRAVQLSVQVTGTDGEVASAWWAYN